MRFILLIFCSALALSLYGQRPQSFPRDSTLKKASLIALVNKEPSIDGVTECTIIRSFKITKPMEDHFLLRFEDDLGYQDGAVCLIYANDDGSPSRYYVDKHSRIVKREDSERDIAFLLSVLPCVDPKLKAKRPCHRIYRPVCGCDSKTYDACEAINNGVVIFSKGECK
jgi:hypothetical protein